MLVTDISPGTGDIALTLGKLVLVASGFVVFVEFCSGQSSGSQMSYTLRHSNRVSSARYLFPMFAKAFYVAEGFHPVSNFIPAARTNT